MATAFVVASAAGISASPAHAQYANEQNFNNHIDTVAREAHAGAAAAMAVNVPGSYVPGKTVMRVGTAAFKGEPALGLSFRRTADNNAWSLTGGVGLSRAGVAATVGAEWVLH
ncbi:YadA-like family protein [Variovorax paradoxus]|nr:YadA-like family protein [Variovorax paradoxus]